MKIAGIILLSILVLTLVGTSLWEEVKKNGWGETLIKGGVGMVFLGLIGLGFYLITA